MDPEKVQFIVLDTLLSCNCKNVAICEKCLFVNLCCGIFTGDWGENKPDRAE